MPSMLLPVSVARAAVASQSVVVRAGHEYMSTPVYIHISGFSIANLTFGGFRVKSPTNNVFIGFGWSGGVWMDRYGRYDHFWIWNFPN